MTTTIKITALSNIGSAISYQTVIPVVNLSGTPETQKANLQITGNLILAGAGGSNFVPAAVATLAENVAGASQPNITQLGTLSELVVSGNIQGANANLGNLAQANYFSGNGNLLSNLQLANVTGAGNIASVNLDGNVSNVLRGDGTWSADTTTYSNSNVVNLLAAFGSNVITTTGLITGDGGGLSNIAVANVNGLGNIATTNYDGNAANVLHGDGSWSADVTDYGDSNVVSLLGAFGSNAIDTTGSITGGTVTADFVQFSDSGGVTESYIGETGFIVGNSSTMTLATLQAEDVRIITDFNGGATTWTFAGNGLLTAPGNVDATGIFNGDGYGLSNIAYANVTGTPTLGNISTIDLDGNASNVLRGDGTFSADANSSYGDSNVASLLNAFGSNTINTTGNISGGNIITTGEANVYSLYAGAGGANIQGIVEIGGDIGNVEYITASGNVSANNFIALGTFNGDGGGLSNVPYANVTGTPTLNILSTSNSTDLGDSTNAINTTGKVLGKMIFNTTDFLIYVAGGATANDNWYPSNGGTPITPAP